MTGYMTYGGARQLFPTAGGAGDVCSSCRCKALTISLLHVGSSPTRGSGKEDPKVFLFLLIYMRLRCVSASWEVFAGVWRPWAVSGFFPLTAVL